MFSVALIVAALALLCVAGALIVMQRGAQHKERASTERFIDSRMAQIAQPALASGGAAAGIGSQTGVLRAQALAQTAEAATGWRKLKARMALAFDQSMNRAGMSNARLPALCALSGSLALSAFAGSRAGTGVFCMTLVTCAVLLYVLMARRILKRRQMIVRQLPSFLDGIVRLIVLGNSVPAAFQASLQTTEAPLRQCLDHVSQMLRAGVEIDRALCHVAQVYRANELELLGAVLRLSVKYGGRADVMLDRMASFMRDLEQAERELSAMSAETRLSAWVLTLLPIGIGVFLIASNPQYFAWMWKDASGQRLVYLAFALQMTGAFLLYRLARLKG
ncbi:type II secretion system F family protein [Paraburkholderia sp. PGU16]|jgi:tight adherence protein B|uniref:Fimbriae-related outer membrane protein n=1 Tax=Paraburkholderia largidicola TaxID=3014751 RepID=A0A7I8BJG6_9BURK|nr:type II secretion system F family protein [Paraburkholderia sp. PGU16]BCF88846.1 fimbriae-related outer membrane protein [Paraburkholderia sp. PGU16]BEU21848.1 type II secretion system F family protein [Paraburkholderia sp. 22B1P]